MIGAMTAGLGCLLIGVVSTYWICIVGMMMIGGGYPITFVPASITMIRIGVLSGMTAEEANGFAPNMADAIGALGKTMGYLIASLLIPYYGYQWSLVLYGTYILTSSGVLVILFFNRFEPPFLNAEQVQETAAARLALQSQPQQAATASAASASGLKPTTPLIIRKNIIKNVENTTATTKF